MARTRRQRLSEKTVERQFLYELEADFELAPATSRALLQAAKQVLLPSKGGGELGEGQMRVTAVGVNEPAGKPLREMKKVSVAVSVDGGTEDLEVLERYGARDLRRARLLRIAGEALDQGGVLTQEDLARLLQVGVRTVRRDVAQLRARGEWVPTRGMVKEMGRGQSHKAKIVELYLKGWTYTEIARRVRHSASAIKRYVESFGRVVVLWERGVREASEVGYLIGMSERLAREYLVLRRRYAGRAYRDRLEEIVGQVRRAVRPPVVEKRGS